MVTDIPQRSLTAPSGRAAAPVVEVQGATYAFDSGSNRKTVLNDVSLTLDRGEFVALTGPSGAGKTTLMTLIGALRTLQAGSIRVLGVELAGLPPSGQREVRRRVGFIFQDHNLFEALTTWQTLRLAMELAQPRPSGGAARQQAIELLAALDMAAHLHARPRALSTGQKQRVAIARALINDPPLILADEPTASLDQDSVDLVIRLLKRRVTETGASVVMVTHDSRLFTVADRVVTMVDGRIVRAP
jgi:putative ABC transport system ATP-binding protein